jgi:hypothetical protein
MKEVKNMREEEKRLCTIKELYDWAVENGYENYEVLVGDDDGWPCHIYEYEMTIDKKIKEIIL